MYDWNLADSAAPAVDGPADIRTHEHLRAAAASTSGERRVFDLVTTGAARRRNRRIKSPAAPVESLFCRDMPDTTSEAHRKRPLSTSHRK